MPTTSPGLIGALEPRDFAKSPAMTLGARKLGREECSNQLLGESGTHDARAEREHVHVVVLHALAGGERVVAEGGANAAKLVGGNRRSHAAAAHQYATPPATVLDCFRHDLGEIRIVVVGVEVVRAAVENVVAGALNRVGHDCLERKTSVIGADGDYHRDWLARVGTVA